MALTKNWNRRHKITIDHSKVDGASAHSNFPVLLANGNFLDNVYRFAKADGGDLRFSSDANGQNQLAHEVVSWDKTNKKSEVWVKIPSLSPSTDTVIYVWYANPSAKMLAPDDDYGSQNAWNSNFKAVYHMNDKSSTIVGESTANSFDATKKGSGENLPAEVAGKVGKAQYFEMANGEYLDAGAVIHDADNDLLTVSLWWKPGDSVANCWYIAHRGVEGGAANTGWSFYGSTAYPILTLSGRFDQIGSNYSPALSNGVWYQIAVTYDKVNVRFFLNGVQVSAHARTSEVIISNQNQFIGSQNYQGSPNGSSEGGFDELRVSNSARSVNWLKTEYNNQNSPSTFSAGSEEKALWGGGAFLSLI